MQTVVENPSWWRKLSILKICLTLISISALIAVIKPAEAFYIEGMNRNGSEIMSSNKSCVENHSDICVSAQCNNTATQVLNKMKPEIQPCEDFYQFACGKFIDEVVIPDDKAIFNTGSDTTDLVQQQLHRVIAEERPPTDPKHLRLPNILYKACMNTTLIESLAATPITNISEALGGWPLIKGDAWDAEDKWTWQDTVKKLRKFGLNTDGIITTFSYYGYFQNNTINMLAIEQGKIDLDNHVLLKGFNDTMVTAYYDYMVDIAVLFGADKEKAKKELREVLEFEISLANIGRTLEESISASDVMNVSSIKQMQESYPYVQWLDYINALLPNGIVVTENEPIRLFIPDYLDDLGRVLSRTPKRVVANYMMWQIHAFAVPFLSEKFRKRNMQYNSVSSGIQKSQSRWKECVDKTSGSLDISVGSLYVQNYFKEESKGIVLEMVNNISSAFADILNEASWMDNITKQKARKKLDSMVARIGYSKDLLNSTKLEGYYSKLELDPDMYFGSILSLNLFTNEYRISMLRRSEAKNILSSPFRPTRVDAFYNGNSLLLPAGILQGHFFNAQRPNYMNYGAIGSFIATVMMGAFDEQGRVNWLQPDTLKVFQDKVTCIREQYGNYTDKTTGLNINGFNTQNGNIDNNGGIVAAYKAYRKWAATNELEPKLPGLDYTPEQLFWISSGQNFCAKFRKEKLIEYIKTHYLAPPEFRVLGSLRNNRDFSKDFNCPEGSPMNPAHKCEFW